MMVCHSRQVMEGGMGVSAATLYTEAAEEGEVTIKACTNYLVEYGINPLLQIMVVLPLMEKEGEGQVGDSEIRRLEKGFRNTMPVTTKIFLHGHQA